MFGWKIPLLFQLSGEPKTGSPYYGPSGTPNSKDNENACFCNRDILIDEFKLIVADMRDTESALKGSRGILNARNCIVEGDRSYEALLKVFNLTAARYGITTCIRKINFLAQTYWESDRFRTTSEYADGSGYNLGRHASAAKNGNVQPNDGQRYKGRGFIQLTWRKNYERYFKYAVANRGDVYYNNYLSEQQTIEFLLNRETESHLLVSKSLFFGMDSAGWFWNFGVIKRDGSAINLNTLCDGNNVNRISVLVNGGGNGKSERAKYNESLQKVMHYEKCINKK